MVFCPHCQTLLSIGKPTPTGGGDLARVLARVVAGRTPHQRHLAGLVPADLKKNPLLTGIAPEHRRVVEGAVAEEAVRMENQIDAVWMCSACGHMEPLQPGTVIHRQDYGGESVEDDLSYIHHDPATPRTRVYLCPEVECPTRDDPSLREAILWHGPRGELTYICTRCNARWNPAL